MKRIIALLITFISITYLLHASVQVTDLKVEQLKDPEGIDIRQPRLGWRIVSDKQNVTQTAYQILVASSPEKLQRDEGDCWNSGKIMSDASQWIAYAGQPLHQTKPYYWKVKVYTTQGDTEWSVPAFWSMGLFTETDWKGQWIGLDKAAPGDDETKWSRLAARYLRKEFTLKKQIKRAVLYVAGLGLHEVYLNGKKIGDQVLAPSPTDYRKTILYNTYDVTSFLQQTNAIGVTLGNGRFYTMRQHYKPYKITNFGYPKLRLNLLIEYMDDSQEIINSDTSWKLTTEGPIRSNNEYDGEIYDARKELTGWSSPGYNDSKWQKAERVSIPMGTLRAQMSPGMKVTEILKPVSIKRLKDRTFIVDFGQNMAGWVRIHPQGATGDSLKLHFAERLNTDGTIYTDNLRDARSTDIYLFNGKERAKDTWAPRFVYHGFRYVEVSGCQQLDTDDLHAEVVEDQMANTGTFTCSDSILNKVVNNARWGIRSNYKGMPVDCPQRNERQPWLGDRTMGCWGESMLFDNHALYTKWTRDIREAQREDGCIPDVAPAYWNYYSDNVTWPAALPMTCDMLYTNYGDIQPIKDNYPAIKRWIRHIKDYYMTQEYIIKKDKYGDWCVPPESLELIHSKDPTRQTDGKLIATAYYLKILQLMHRFATIQNLKAEAEEWETLEHTIKDAFNKQFLHVKKGTSPVPGHILYPDSIFYGNNTVTANILPLAFGLVPKEYISDVIKNTVATIITTNKGHISTGVIGVQWLLRELSRRGYADIAYLLATNKTYPSWGYMTEHGATTIWELWNGDKANPKMNSGNHVMLLGDLLPWCFNNLAGIRTDRWKTGYKHIILQPEYKIENCDNGKASYQSIYGKIVSEWKRTPTHFSWDVEIPANTTAEVHFPNGDKRHIGSGKYHFELDIPIRDKAILKDEFLYETTTFPECHSATITELQNGDLIAAFFGGTKERNPDCSIWVCRKAKGSRTWTKPQKAADGVFLLGDKNADLAGINETTTPVKDTSGKVIAHRKACWNPVLYQIPGDDLVLFYKIGLKVSDWSGWLVRSKNGGRTWSKRQPLPKGFIGPVKNKPEMIGEAIICPSSTEENGWRIHFELTDKKLQTWEKIGPLDAELSVPTQKRIKNGINSHDQEGGEAIKQDGAQPIFAIQPSLLRHKDGSLQILCRTRNAALATAWSKDNGQTWSRLQLSVLPSNNSGTDAVTMKDGRQVLIYNDFATLSGTPKGPRTPLCIAVSEDGIHWKKVLTLEDSPVSQYSYPSIIKGSDGKLHVIYTWRRQRIKYMEIDPGRF